MISYVIYRNLAISIQAHRALMPFVSEAESLQMMATSPHIIPEIIDCLKLALKEEDHYSYKYTTLSIPAKGFLLLLNQLAASHETCAEMIVKCGTLSLLLAYMQCNPDIHYWSVRRAAECLWTIVQVAKDKHVPAVGNLTDIQPSIWPFHACFFSISM